jgi:16S rRNA (guanine966-N2)-methyltransferase
MRVIAGRYRGHRLSAPKSAATRPTSDRVREAIFALLGTVENLSVLDLFAGSGALGIEALSRGATGASFVERRSDVVKVLRANLKALGLTEPVYRQDVRTFLRRAQRQFRQFDLILLDPPYDLAEHLMSDLSELLPSVLADLGRVVVESSWRAPLQLELRLDIERRYGDTLVRIYGA